jgi:hypothetical protein
MGSSTPSSPSGNTYTKKIEYNMDDDGNRTSVVTTHYGVSPTTVSYTDNSLNQYTVVGGTNRSHDGNGNVSDDGTYTYAFNYKNLIVKATRKSDSVVVGEYKYDALGRRVEKAVTGATYRYIYSGVETVSVYTSTGTWKQDYVYGPVIDEVIMLEQADVLDWDADSNTTELARSWYMRSALGSVLQIQEHDRTEAVTYRYDPYGEVTITRGGSGQSSDPLGQYVTYTGRWRDEEIGKFWTGRAAYDPTVAGLMQRDPGGVCEGTPIEDSMPVPKDDKRPVDSYESKLVSVIIGDGSTLPRIPEAYGPKAQPGASVQQTDSKAFKSGALPSGLIGVAKCTSVKRRPDGGKHTIFFEVRVYEQPSPDSDAGVRGAWAEAMLADLAAALGDAGRRSSTAADVAGGEAKSTKSMVVYEGHGLKEWVDAVPWKALAAMVDHVVAYVCYGASFRDVAGVTWHVGREEEVSVDRDAADKVVNLVNDFAGGSFADAMANLNRELEFQRGMQVWRGDRYDDGEKKWVPSKVRPLQPPTNKGR